MALLTTQSISKAGIVPTYTAAAGGGDTMVPGATDFLHVKNGGGSSITVTLAIPASLTFDGLAVTSPTATITAGSEQMIKVIPERYRDPTTGLAVITYSGVTTVTVAAIRS